ncbi:DUF4337 domain-containing protein [Pseudomonas oryzihabitans]|uniref:DUF4337 domain-containing protein n=1 Tax=Pseudomonas oryzihabitans TaxID=47885 RepID=UPI00214EF628|nr:DUF4337 domain-containing protein [Pseudomonas psychrotolerans]UUW70492.1 DUF4337 domain-containing protein [Pseudomonas psychrotolerans]
MSSEYEVHGPHDHEVEHAAHGAHRRDSLTGRIAVTTAILATLGALCAYQGGNAESLALYYKNEEAIAKTEAANQWGYYQAKGEKQNLADLGAALATNPDTAQRFTQDSQRYAQQKAEIRTKAEALEAKVDANEALSETQLHRHHRWAQATMLMQVAISLAAITLLTRRRWLQAAGGGVVVGVLALLHV